MGTECEVYEVIAANLNIAYLMGGVVCQIVGKDPCKA
jgi:hypothetical protein